MWRGEEPLERERLKTEAGCEGAVSSSGHAAPQRGTSRADPLSGMLEKMLFL